MSASAPQPGERVFVTGLGAVTSLGPDVRTLWEGLLAGRSGIRRLTRVDTSDLPVGIGGEVPDDFVRAKVLEGRPLKNLDRATRFALVAAEQALEQSGLNADSLTRAAVVLGSGLSGLDTLAEQTERLLRSGPERVSPFTIPRLMPNAPAAHTSLAFGITGPSYVTSTACASSGYAMIEAAEAIVRRERDVVVTGGTESSLIKLGFAAFARMRALPQGFEETPERAVRPFDGNRRGLVMSEGAGVLVLESGSSVASRGATPLAELIGWGATSDSHHIVQPDPAGVEAARAITTALDRAGLDPTAIADRTYVNAHGTGTVLNDAAETRALRRAFGAAADRLRVSSTKSMTGHLIGATTGVEAIASILALREGVLPPTINYETPDPDCDLDCVPNEARRAEVEYAIDNGFAFGGHNVSLVLARC